MDEFCSHISISFPITFLSNINHQQRVKLAVDYISRLDKE